jgi:hypothetical protein
LAKGKISRGKVEQSPRGKDRLEQILKFDKGIRYCCVVDQEGKILEGKGREDLVSLEPESEDKRLFAQISIAVGMDKSWDKYFGSTQCIVIAKEKINIFVYPLSDLRSIVIATEPDLAVSKLRQLGQLVDTTDFGRQSTYET